MVIKLFRSPLTVDKEHSAGFDVVYHFIPLYNVRGIMASHKIGFIYIIRTLYRFVPETEVRYRYTSRLFGVILEISLNIFIGMVSDNLYRVFVSPDGSVASETPEFTLYGAFRAVFGEGFSARDSPVTSSTIPIVKLCLGSSFASSS